MSATGSPETTRKKLSAARAKLAAAVEAVRIAEEQVAQCERDLRAAEAAVKAREEAKAREKAEKEASKAQAQAEREAAKARKATERGPRAKPAVDSEAFRTLTQDALRLYEEALDPAFDFDKLDAFAQSLDKSLGKDQLTELAHQMNIPGSFKTKKEAVKEIRGKIAFRRNTLDRVNVSSASRPLD